MVAVLASNEVVVDSSFDFIHHAFRKNAIELADAINTESRARIESAIETGRKLIDAKKQFSRRKEFTRFRESLKLSLGEAKACMKLARFFGDWAIEKVVDIASATNILTLCQEKYSDVLEQFRTAANLTKEFVRNVVKKNRPARKPKQSADVGWKPDPSEGGRHLQINLYDEAVGMTILQEAERRGITGQKFLTEAVAHYVQPQAAVAVDPEVEQKYQQMLDEMRRKHQQEIQQTITEVRDRDIQLQHENNLQAQLLKEIRLENEQLKAQLAEVQTIAGYPTSEPELEPEPEPEKEPEVVSELESEVQTKLELEPPVTNRTEPMPESDSEYLETESESDDIECDSIFLQAKAIQLSLPEVQSESAFAVGDEVQIITENKGASLLGKIGIITAIGTDGATVRVSNRLVWFEAKEFEVPF